MCGAPASHICTFVSTCRVDASWYTVWCSDCLHEHHNSVDNIFWEVSDKAPLGSEQAQELLPKVVAFRMLHP